MKVCATIVSGICGVTLLMAEEAKLVLVADGFERPLDLRVAPGDEKHLFIVEQTGKIIAIERESGKRVQEVMSLSTQILNKHNEEGLLGLVFSPSFERDSRFYVYYTAGDQKNRETRISRFTMNPETLRADAGGEEIIFKFAQDFDNHNGGWIDFGPDGFLWLGLGDGGSGNDPKRRAQDLGNVLGSLLRIDVSGAEGYRVPSDNPFVKKEGAKPEIYCYGLRNPWRCSFDAKTGDLWVADVGQNHWEEVNFVPAGKAKGANFGWRPREGTHRTWKDGVGGKSPKGEHKPIYEYGHDMSKPTDGLSITGGYVYRGPRADLQGKYFFADYASRRIWAIKEKNGKATDFEDYTDQFKVNGKQLGPITSFGEDHDRNLYVIDQTGKIFRIE